MNKANASHRVDVLEASAMLGLSRQQRSVMREVAAQMEEGATIREVLGAFASRVGDAIYRLNYPDEVKAHNGSWHFPFDEGKTHVFANVNTYYARGAEPIEEVRFAIVRDGELVDDVAHPDTYRAYGELAARGMRLPEGLPTAPNWHIDEE